MESFEVTGRTVDEALKAAEERVGRPLTREEYRVVDQGSRGVLGLIGFRPARIQVVPKGGEPTNGSMEAYAAWCAKSLLEHMGMEAEVHTATREGCIEVDLRMSEEDGALLIGRHGATLEAFQHLLRRMVERKAGEAVAVVVDVGSYRQRRRNVLVQKALRLAEQVKRTGRQVTLDPMPPGDRRAVHMALKGDKGVTTYSVGEEPDRKVVIAPAEGAGPRKAERKAKPSKPSAGPKDREGPRQAASQEREVTKAAETATPVSAAAVEEVVPSSAPLYGRRRLYRRPKNKPTKPMTEDRS